MLSSIYERQNPCDCENAEQQSTTKSTRPSNLIIKMTCNYTGRRFPLALWTSSARKNAVLHDRKKVGLEGVCGQSSPGNVAPVKRDVRNLVKRKQIDVEIKQGKIKSLKF